MALRIYREADPDTAYSVDDTFSNPFALACDGSEGFIYTKRLYVRNDDPAVQYSNIIVQPIDTGTRHIVDGSDLYSWKLLPGDPQPTELQWSLTDAGSAIYLVSGLDYLSGIVTYLPFWVRVEVPAGSPVESFRDVKLRTIASEDRIA